MSRCPRSAASSIRFCARAAALCCRLQASAASCCACSACFCSLFTSFGSIGAQPSGCVTHGLDIVGAGQPQGGGSGSKGLHSHGGGSTFSGQGGGATSQPLLSWCCACSSADPKPHITR